MGGVVPVIEVNSFLEVATTRDHAAPPRHNGWSALFLLFAIRTRINVCCNVIHRVELRRPSIVASIPSDELWGLYPPLKLASRLSTQLSLP
jgi:hypothetical protein